MFAIPTWLPCATWILGRLVKVSFGAESRLGTGRIWSADFYGASFQKTVDEVMISFKGDCQAIERLACGPWHAPQAAKSSVRVDEMRRTCGIHYPGVQI